MHAYCDSLFRRSLQALVVWALIGLPPFAQAEERGDPLAKYQKPLEAAISRAQEFLAKQQSKNGCFPSGLGQSTGITSLCVMAFLATGHTPGLGDYGDVINKGVDFVLQSQKPDGLLIGQENTHGPWYCHTIATLMLSEVSGMVDPRRQELVDKALAKALGLVLKAQKVRRGDPRQQGGWRYQASSNDSDISLTGWSLMDLRSARNNGAPIPRESIEEAVKFIMNCRARDGGFGYQPGGGPGSARTGTALLCLELSGRHRSPETVGAGNWVLEKGVSRESDGFFHYALYYCTQGMFQLGEEHWEKYAPDIYEMMLQRQNADGSWPTGQGNEGSAGVSYSTAMAVLALTVPYCQLPIYQR